jgi:hypothetical protein
MPWAQVHSSHSKGRISPSVGRAVAIPGNCEPNIVHHVENQEVTDDLE